VHTRRWRGIVRIEIGKQPLKYLLKCEDKIYVKLINAIEDLRKLKGDIKKLKGREDYRLKIPPYRVIFKYDYDKIIILVTKISTRGDAYKE